MEAIASRSSNTNPIKSQQTKRVGADAAAHLSVGAAITFYETFEVQQEKLAKQQQQQQDGVAAIQSDMSEGKRMRANAFSVVEEEEEDVGLGDKAENTMHLTEQLLREHAIQVWMREVLMEGPFDEPQHVEPYSLIPDLRDGIRLCKLMETLKPKSIPRINTGTVFFRNRENISFFLAACEEWGVSRFDRFRLEDLYEDENFGAVANCLERIGAKAHREHNFIFSIAPTEYYKTLDLTFPKSKKLWMTRCLRKTFSKRRASLAGFKISFPPGLDLKPNGFASMRGSSPAQNSFRHAASPCTSGAAGAAHSPQTGQRLLKSTLHSDKLLVEVASHGASNDRRFPQHYELETSIKRIVKVQCLWRGKLARKEYAKKVRRAAYREKVAREILSTEKTYVEILSRLICYYLQPIENFHKTTLRFEGILTLMKNARIIFSFNSDLLQSLDPRIQAWYPCQQLGDIFVHVAQYLRLYTQYVRDYGQALNDLRNARRESPEFAEWEEGIKNLEEVKGQALTTLLIQPIQRIPRYLLLLQELQKHTEEDHADHQALLEALRLITEVAAFIEKKADESENISKMISIQSRLQGKYSVIQPDRKLIKEGYMEVWSRRSRKQKKRVMFLFNDILLETKIARKTSRVLTPVTHRTSSSASSSSSSTSSPSTPSSSFSTPGGGGSSGGSGSSGSVARVSISDNINMALLQFVDSYVLERLTPHSQPDFGGCYSFFYWNFSRFLLSSSLSLSHATNTITLGWLTMFICAYRTRQHRALPRPSFRGWRDHT
ncbi:hypothetical protein QOT17_007521 [Balamuthia mandrillaris]